MLRCDMAFGIDTDDLLVNRRNSERTAEQVMADQRAIEAIKRDDEFLMREHEKWVADHARDMEHREWFAKGETQGASHAIGTINRMYGESDTFPIHTDFDLDIRAMEQVKSYAAAPPIFRERFIAMFKKTWEAERKRRITFATVKDMAVNKPKGSRFKRIERVTATKGEIGVSGRAIPDIMVRKDGSRFFIDKHGVRHEIAHPDTGFLGDCRFA